MRLLSKESAKNARAAQTSFGSWKAAKSEGTRRDDGVIVLKRDGRTGKFKSSPNKK